MVMKQIQVLTRRVTTSSKLLGTTWRAPVTGESEVTGDHMEGREDQILYFRCGDWGEIRGVAGKLLRIKFI